MNLNASEFLPLSEISMKMKKNTKVSIPTEKKYDSEYP